MLKWLWSLIPYTHIDYCESAWIGKQWERFWFKGHIQYVKLIPNVVRPSTKITAHSAEESITMNIGDKVIAVGAGRKTKELNNGDIERPESKLPGFTGLVVDMQTMTVEEIDGQRVTTKAGYLFHRDDLHLVDTGRASAKLS